MKLMERPSNKVLGFTLIEMLVTVCVLAILVGIAIPSYNKFITQKRLRIGAEDLYNFIKAAQSVSLNKQTTTYVSFKTGSNWCYGLSDTAACDCSTVNSCTVNGLQTVINSTRYTGPSMTLDVAGFSGAASSPYILFQGNRGTVGTAGSASLGLSSLSVTISTNTMGLVTICSDNISGYPSCTNP